MCPSSSSTLTSIAPPLKTSSSPLLPPLGFRGLCLPAPSVDVVRKDDAVESWTGGDEMGQTAPRTKYPRRPLAVVGVRRSVTWFQHLVHKTQPVNCLPELRLLHARIERPVENQVKCQVQIQHHPTCLRARLKIRLTVKTLLLPPLGVYPFIFLPPDVPDSV